MVSGRDVGMASPHDAAATESGQALTEISPREARSIQFGGGRLLPDAPFESSPCISIQPKSPRISAVQTMVRRCLQTPTPSIALNAHGASRSEAQMR